MMMMMKDPAAMRPQPARDGVDLWRTPPDLIAALTDHVLPQTRLASSGVIWEPAAGAVDIVDALTAKGFPVVASDIAPRHAGIRHHDFLHDAPLPETRSAVGVTNPPFREPLLDQFITRSIELVDRLHLHAVVLLVRIDHLTAAGRAAAFNRAWRVWICCWRPRWIPGSTGNGRWAFAWVVWKRASPGPPVIRWLTPRDPRQLELLSAE